MYDESVRQRFMAKVSVQPDGCWYWIASKNKDGYGHCSTKRGKRLAHRFVYELLVGPIPEGLQLDHLCRVRHCVNPAHMEPVTSAENTRRGETGRNNTVKTHCPKGHAYSGDNVRFERGDRDGTVKRRCRECMRQREKTRDRSGRKQQRKRK